jgi:sortase A
LGCAVGLFALAGVLFIVAGGIMAYPLIRDAFLPPPASFGEAQPPLRPTVTPLPREGQPAFSATPALLPETPLLTPGQPLPSPIPALPDITDPSAKLPTRLVIPAIDLDAPIEPVGWSQANGVSTWNIPDHFAAGWLETSAPWGQPGNTVLDGHHNMAGEVFRDLVDLKAGDVIEVYASDRVRLYAVTALHILPDRDQSLDVRRRNAAWIQPTWDERLTLVTCWPDTSNTHRLIVIAAPVDMK